MTKSVSDKPHPPINPTFIIIGAAKCGTTSLFQMIQQHPDAFLSTPKEVRFFSDEANYERGTDWYFDHFEGGAGRTAVGECSPHYSIQSFAPNAVNRMVELLPDVKLIYMVRNPLDRILSHYRMYQRAGDGDFSDLEADLKSGKYDGTLVDPSLYWRQLSAYRERFPDEQIKVVIYEEFVADPAKEFRRVCDFLALPALPDVSTRQANRNESSIQLHPRFDWFPLNVPWRVLRKFAGRETADHLLELLPTIFTLRRVPGDARWTRGAYEQVIEALREDTAHFLKHMGKTSDYWDLSFERLAETPPKADTSTT